MESSVAAACVCFPSNLRTCPAPTAEQPLLRPDAALRAAATVVAVECGMLREQVHLAAGRDSMSNGVDMKLCIHEVAQ